MRALPDRHRLLRITFITPVLLLACSVFPDEAVLPASSVGTGGDGDGGGAPSPVGGKGGGSGAGTPTGGTGTAGTSTEISEGGAAGAAPGAAGSVGQGGGAGTSGGTGQGQGGEGGQAGEPGGQAGTGGVGGGTCETPLAYVVKTTLDAWIDSADVDANYGGASLLYVNGGSAERRALFEITLPAALAGARLLRAEIVLSLLSNADTSKAVRRLQLWRLQPRAIREDKVTWTHFAQGSGDKNAWDAGGGDLAELLAERALPAGTTQGLLGFDVLAKLPAVLSASASTYQIAVLESGASPAAAELGFTSRESTVPGWVAPELRLSYCPP